MTTMAKTNTSEIIAAPRVTTTPEGKKITVIPATKSLHPERDGVTPIRPKIRVAAYCRVSTLLEEQQSSYSAQKNYYEKFIANHPDWELVGIYGDEGKSGTTLSGRTGFLEMMDDARAGMIDRIITKATSRFGRNNTEFMQILDELDFYGVEVLFESEGIVTTGQQNRMMLQIMGATNEHYSNSLSNNVRWSRERSMREGKVTICYKRFLGYEKGEDGKPKIVEEEAKTVRLIFKMFLKGKSYSVIARYLNENGYLTATGKTAWTAPGVRRILENEKYTGDVLMQKTFKRSYLDKRARVNTGERPQVLIENNHEPIIDKSTFAKVQKMIAKHSCKNNRGTDKGPFTGKIICEHCNDYYGHRTWSSRGNIKYGMWVCIHKYTEETVYNNKRCKSVNLRQEWVEQGYLDTINRVLAARSEYLAKYEGKLRRLNHQLETTPIKANIKTLKRRIREIVKAGETLSQEWELTFGKNDEFMSKQASLKSEMNQALAKKAALEDEFNNLRIKQAEIITLINTLKELPANLMTFNKVAEDSFSNIIDYISVNSRSITYHLYGGERIKLKVEDVKNAFLRRT